MKKLNLILAIMVVSGVVGISHSGGVGTTGAQFLKIDPSARPIGMGGAYSAVSDDSSAIFYNPAGIAHLKDKEISGTYLKYFQSINYGSLSGVMPLRKGVFGVGINYLGVTDIEKRGTEDVDDKDGTSSPPTFGAMDTAISLCYAVQNAVPAVLKNLDIGGNLRFIYQTIDEESAFSVMLDAGGYYSVNEKLSLALSIQNIGMAVKFKDEADPLPLNLKAGAAYKPLDGLTVACDINEYIIDELLYVSMGAEYWIKEIVAFRAGYKYGYDIDSLGEAVGFAGGFGLRYWGLRLDYSFAPFGSLGDTHRITISFSL